MDDDLKEDPADFAVWKAAKPGEPYWNSPWGHGRPGWHIECSAMARKHLGKTIDLHAGGQDLIFPHHENEIAQSECANGCTFSRYWMHNGFLNINNEKMSKSANNFFTVREIADKYGYEPIRYFMLTAGYRMPLNYTVELIESCKNSLERMYTCRDNLDFAIEHAHGTDTALVEKCEEARKKFKAAMDDDLNTPDALAAIFELVKDINTLSDASDKATLEDAAKTFDELTGVLGLLYNRKKTDSIPARGHRTGRGARRRQEGQGLGPRGRHPCPADRDGLECHRHCPGPEAREAVRSLQKNRCRGGLRICAAGRGCAGLPLILCVT